MLMILWSRDLTSFRRWKSVGSAISSHHVTVNTTEDAQYRADDVDSRELTRRGELRAQALAHNALETETCGDEAERDIRCDSGPDIVFQNDITVLP
jgi:hypothetical protein